MANTTTFVFDNGKTYAIREGKVVAADADPDVVERQVKEAYGMPGDEVIGPGGGYGPDMTPVPNEETCPECGGLINPANGVCETCGTPLDPSFNPWTGHEPDDHGPMDSDPYDSEPGLRPMARTIITPNGLKGKVLGKVAGLWKDEVTVRLENGNIVHLPVTEGMKFEAATREDRTSPVEALEARLSAEVVGTRDSLLARRKELVQIKKFASKTIREGVSIKDAESLDRLIVTADHEMIEVNDAINHLDHEDTQAFAPPSVPFEMQAVEQETMGGNGGEWLDNTFNEMIADVESTDFKTLMDEGPEAFVAELPDSSVADAEVTHQLASNYIRSKTAGTDPRVRDPYESTWLTRVEQVRRDEAPNRTKTTPKEAAATDQYTDLPDDHFFV